MFAAARTSLSASFENVFWLDPERRCASRRCRRRSICSMRKPDSASSRGSTTVSKDASMETKDSHDQPWQWPDHHWRKLVEQVRAGRALCPTAWPGLAQCAVALSFDCDHETSELREGGNSIGR